MIETLWAGVLGVVVLGALLILLVGQNRERRSNSEGSRALTAALNALEKVRSLPHAGIPAVNASGFDVLGENGQTGGLEPVKGDADGLPGQLTVVVDDSFGSATLYRVAATVTWTGASGRRQMRVETLIAERKQ